MQHLAPLGRLRWRLTLSYTLVTVGALIAAEVVLVGCLLAIALWPGFLPRMIAEGVYTELAPSVRPYLVANPPDAGGLQEWLGRSVDYEGALSSGGPVTVQTGDSWSGAWVIVLDPTGRFLGSTPPGLGRTGERFEVDALPGLRTVLPLALSGSQDFGRLFARSRGGRLTVAVPVLSDQGAVLGALVVALDMPPLGIVDLTEVLRAVGVSLAVFALVAGMVGTVFGFLTARGLSRRLGRLSGAADAWSRGDFSVVATDRSRDELGQLARSLNRMSEQVENLLHTREELAALEERNRLARDLHDSVKQQVFATAMQLAAAKALVVGEPQAALAHLGEAEKLTEQAQRELNDLVLELRPPALEGKWLAGALRDHVEGWARQTGIAVDLRAQGERSLPLEMEQALFRATQEALSNVARHSHASHAEVLLEWAGNSFTLTVSDDGTGFDARAESEGLGLTSMRERVEAQGGTMHVRSEPGAGTTLVFRFDDLRGHSSG